MRLCTLVHVCRLGVLVVGIIGKMGFVLPTVVVAVCDEVCETVQLGALPRASFPCV